jgi:TP901 family phage tail tape measure protein
MAVATKLGTLSVILDAKTGKLVGKLKTSEKQVEGFSRKVEAAGKRMAAVGKKLTTYVTLPLLAIGAASVKAAAGFDKAMTESTAILGGVTDSMRKKMEETAKQMSTRSTYSAKQLGEAYYFLASAGFNAAQSQKVLSTVTKFAQAGAFDLSTATSLLAGSTAALGLKSKDATKTQQNMVKVSDVLMRATTLADATTEQFATALTRAGGIMKAFDVDVEEGTAVLAAFAEVQRKGEVGGEAFGRVLRLLIPAANKHADAYAKLGIRVFDAQGNLRNFALILKDMERALAPMSAATKSAALEALGFQKRFQGAILPLMGMSEKIMEYEKELRKAAGTTETVYKKQLEAFSNKLTIVKNRLILVGITIGEKLIPYLEKGAAWVEKMAKKFQALDGATVERWIKIGFAVAALGPALMIAGNALKTAAIVGTFFKISAAATAATTAASGTAAALGAGSAFAVGGPIALGILGIAAALGIVIGKFAQVAKESRAAKEAMKLGKVPGTPEVAVDRATAKVGQLVKASPMAEDARRKTADFDQGNKSALAWLDQKFPAEIEAEKKAQEETNKRLQKIEETANKQLEADLKIWAALTRDAPTHPVVFGTGG